MRGRHDAARGRRQPARRAPRRSRPHARRLPSRRSAAPDWRSAVVPLYLPRRRPLGDWSACSTRPTRRSATTGPTLIEAIIGESEDETLLDSYLAGEPIDTAVLVADLEAAVCRGHLHPVVPIDAATDLGLGELLDLIVAGLPVAARAAAADRLDADRRGRAAAGLRSGRPAGGAGRAHLGRPLRRPGVAGPGLLRARSAPTPPLHVSGHGGAERGHPDHDADERGGDPAQRQHGAGGADRRRQPVRRRPSRHRRDGRHACPTGRSRW